MSICCNKFKFSRSVSYLFRYFQGLSQSWRPLDVGWMDGGIDGWMDGRKEGGREGMKVGMELGD